MAQKEEIDLENLLQESNLNVIPISNKENKEDKDGK